MTSVSPTPKDTEAERREAQREEVARAMHQAHHGRRGYFFDEPNATEAWESGGVDTRYWLLLADDAVAAVLAASPAEGYVCHCGHDGSDPNCPVGASPAVTAAEDETGGRGAQVHPFRHALGRPSWRCRDCDAPFNHRIHGNPGLPAPAITAVPADPNSED